MGIEFMESTINNNLKEDFLDVDNPIPGQNFACVSFISPENVIKNKDIYIFENFIKHFFDENNTEDIKKYSYSEILEKYNDFKFINESELTKTFYTESDCKTCLRGLKIRGVYDTYKEAQIRAQVLQRLDNSFNIYIAQVGAWVPWDPSPDEVQDQEYQESELNDLMKEYKKNQQQKDLFFQE